MAGRDPRRRGDRLRLLAGVSVVLGTVTLLMSSDRKGRAADGPDDRSGVPDDGGEHGGPPSAEALKDGFEPKDANTRTLAVVMVVSVGIIAVCVAGLFALLGVFHHDDRIGPPLTREQRAVIIPPGPPLQASPQYDLAALDKKQIALLSSYAWLSPLHTAARIPIDRAMALVVGRPLGPAPKAPAGGSP